MKDKRQRMAFSWPDPTLYAYLLNAAVASLQQQHPGYPGSSPPTGAGTLPPPPFLPPSAAAFSPAGLYASASLQRVAAAAASANPGPAADPLALMRAAAVAAAARQSTGDLEKSASSAAVSPCRGHVVGMPCSCPSCCYGAAPLMTSSMSPSRPSSASKRQHSPLPVTTAFQNLPASHVVD